MNTSTHVNPSLSIVKLVLLMLLIHMASLHLFAQFAGGNGTYSDPWQISNATQLNSVRNYLGYTHNNKYFIQTDNIDLGMAPWNQGEGWSPIGQSYSVYFSGHYDGDGYKVSGLYINRPTGDYQGLFGYTSGATIINVNITDFDITAHTCVGSLVGRADAETQIMQCSAAGVLNGYSSSGGMVGLLDSSTMYKCFTGGEVNAESHACGGLTGYAIAKTCTSNCYSSSSVSGNSNVGGLIGYLASVGSNHASVYHCYSTGFVSGNSGSGGLIGFGGGSSVSCFWNVDTSGQSTSAGGYPRTTAQMTLPFDNVTYMNWNFDGVWASGPNSGVNGGYPYFANTPGIITPQAIAPTNGNGTVNSPYQITNLGNLYWIAVDTSRWNKHYSQTNDIDASETLLWGSEGWTPIGSSIVKFTGSYNGHNHCISGLYINRPSEENTGLFGYILNASISNVVLVDGHISGERYVGGISGYGSASNLINCQSDGNISGSSQVGGLAGYLISSNIRASSSTGRILGGYSGGLIGYIGTSCSLTNCFSHSDVFSFDNGGLGGLIGHVSDSSSIRNCFATGSIVGVNWDLGGLIGRIYYSSVYNSYSTGSVTGDYYGVGGFAGGSQASSFHSCYSNGMVTGGPSPRGFLGSLSSPGVTDFENCYWDIESSGCQTSWGGEGRTTTEMTFPYSPFTYFGWDPYIWIPDIGSNINSGYPYLYYQIDCITTLPEAAIEPAPANGSASIANLPTLSWKASLNEEYTNFPQGFKLWLGTNNPPSNIVAGIDLEDDLSYTIASPLATNTNHYWRVVPYNYIGEALNCPVWSFSTHNLTPVLSYPTGGQQWLSETTQVIRWQPNGPPLVKLHISFDNGATWHFIADTDGSKGYYYYEVPVTNSTACKVKISSALNESYNSVSTSSFSISTSTNAPKLILTSPSIADAHYGVGQILNLNWTRQNVSLVALDYSIDNGESWTQIITGLNASSYEWTVGDHPSSQCRVRVRSYLDPQAFDISNNAFRVNKLQVIFPNGGEIITGDHSGIRTYYIAWEASYIDNVKIDYSANGGSNWTSIVDSTPAERGWYEWIVPGIPTANGLIRITDIDNISILAISTAAFMIQNPIRLMNTNGGGFATNNSLLNIRWLPQDIASDKFIWWEYSPNGSTWTRINQNAVPITDHYLGWVVNTGLQDNLWLKALDHSNGCVVGKSEAPFRVTSKQLKITAPVTGTTLGVDSYALISWQADGCTSLSIDYTTDFGATWHNIATGIPSAAGSYLWQVPNSPSDLCRIRLRDTSFDYMWVESEGEFSIYPFSFAAAFHASNTSGYADLDVQFYDDSVGIVNSWAWDFNDDGVVDSTIQNPIWTYRVSGFYSVTLTVSDGETMSSSTRENFIYVYPMNANFQETTTSGFLPLTVQFTNTTPSDVEILQWDFDSDGCIDSTDENPVWTYLFPGTYTVTLTVSNGFDTDTEIKTDLVIASLNPDHTFYVFPNRNPIQQSINAAANGDYIIVADGLYYENLVIQDKDITLASWYFVDGDSTHVYNTIIDGGNAINPDEGSVITLLPGTTRPVRSPHICGFTIRNGSGRKILQNIGGNTVEKRVGGGIYINQTNPMLTQNRIDSNDADDEGGGSYAFQSLPNLGGLVGAGVFNPGGNVFLNNYADIGKDFYVYGTTGRDAIKMQNCRFDVFSRADTTITNYWGTSEAPLDLSGSQGTRNTINADIYVATDGNDVTNSGLSPASPFKTIDHALSRAKGSPQAPVTIHIAPGVYSPSFTGESFPLQMVNWVSLAGAGSDETILDAEANAEFPCRVIAADKVQGASIRDITITGGYVTTVKNYHGGGLAILDSQVDLQKVTIAFNSSAGHGAGMFVLDSEVNMDSLTITSNSAFGSGGGVFSGTSSLSVFGAEVSGNNTNKNGGGIFADQGTLSVRHSTFTSNQANSTLSYGGAISVSGIDQPLLLGNSISGNQSRYGAGIYSQSSTNIRFDRNKIVNNSAPVMGGGILLNTTTGTLSNNLIANNTANQRGGGIYSYSAVNIINNTLVNNRATTQGGAMYLNASSPVLKNSILWGNTSGQGNQAYLSGVSSPAFFYCDVQGGTSGFAGSAYSGTYQNNLNANPQFISPTAGAGISFDALAADFSIPEGSPCVDMGDPATDVSAMPLDLAGFTRLSGTAIDIGSYEYQHPITFLNPPQNISVTISGNTITLSWDAVAGASFYRVFAGDNPLGTNWTEIPFQTGSFSQNGGRLAWSIELNGATKRFYSVKASTTGQPGMHQYPNTPIWNCW